MRGLPTALFGIFLLVVTVNGASAQALIRELPQAGKFSLEPVLGTAFIVESTWASSLSTSSSIRFGSSSTITATLVTNDQEFDDVYDIPVKFGASLNYGLSDRSEVFGGLKYTYAEADTFDAATVSVSGNFSGTPINVGETIEGEFDDYQEFALNIGFRRFFDAIYTGVHPFVSLTGSVRWNDQVDLTLRDGSSEIGGIGYFDDGFAFGVGIGVGFRAEISDGIVAGLETGIRYEGDMSEDNSSLGDGDLNGLQGRGDRWEIPVMLRVTYRLN